MKTRMSWIISCVVALTLVAVSLEAEERARADSKGELASGVEAMASSRPRILHTLSVGVQSWRNNPVLLDDLLLISSSGSHWNAPDEMDGLYAFDIETGKQRWFVRTRNDCNDLAVIDGHVVAGSDAGEVVAVKLRSGRVRWRQWLGRKVYARPVAVPGGVAVATSGGYLALLKLRNGAVRERIALDGGVRAGLTASEGDLWVTTEAGTVYRFNAGRRLQPVSEWPVFYPDEYGTPDSGPEQSRSERAWSERLGQGNRSRASLYAPLLVTEDRVLVNLVRQTSYDYPPIAAFEQTGELVWYGTDAERKLDGFGNARFAPAVWQDLVILGNPYSNSVYALSLDSGELQWAVRLGQELFQHWSTPVVVGDAVYVARHDGYLHKLRARGGHRTWSLFLGARDRAGTSLLTDETVPGEELGTEWNSPAAHPIFSTPAVSGGMIAVGTGEGYVYVIQDAGRPRSP